MEGFLMGPWHEHRLDINIWGGSHQIEVERKRQETTENKTF
jgi:hypothetical protein